MAVEVAAKITPGLLLTRVDTLSPGYTGGNLDIRLPSDTLGGRRVPGQPIALTAAKAWARKIDLVASTPVDLDLSALAGGQGDTVFASVCLVDIRSLEAPDSGHTVTVGNSGGASEWYDPIGAAGGKVTIRPGVPLTLVNRDTGGWAVGTRHILRLDPGANNQSVLVAFAGN